MNAIQTIQETEDEIVEEFSLFDNWEDKYEYIIDLGKKLEPLEPEFKIDENKIKGCQSQVWLIANEDDGRIFFKADSDAVIVRGLVSMLIRVLSGVTVVIMHMSNFRIFRLMINARLSAMIAECSWRQLPAGITINTSRVYKKRAFNIFPQF